MRVSEIRVKRIRVNQGLGVVTFTLISNLATDYIQKRKGEESLASSQFWQQIIFKREEESLASSLLNIICRQN